METVKQKERYDYIDIAKAFGMLAVMWGHIRLSGWSWVFVYSFDIPLFFFLSGMMYKAEKYTTLFQLLKNRCRTLLLPYAVISVATWLLWTAVRLIIHKPVDFQPLLQTAMAQGSTGYLIHNVPLWFVTCLIVVEILYYFIAKWPDTVNVLLCVVMAVVGHLMLHNGLDFDFTKLPWNIEAAMSAILFYSLGNLFIKWFGIGALPTYTREHKIESIVLWAGLTAITAIAGWFNGHVTLGSNSLGNNTFVFYVVGLCGTFSVLLFSCLMSHGGNNPLTASGKWIGKNSFYFMAFHVPIISYVGEAVNKAVEKVLPRVEGTVQTNPVLSGLMFVLTLILTAALVWVVGKGLTMKRKTPAL